MLKRLPKKGAPRGSFRPSYDERMVPGMKVRLSGRFLKSTGQSTGPEGQKRWVVQDCPCPLCQGGDTVAVNEKRAELGFWTAEELESMPWLVMRHIMRCNLTLVGRPSIRDDA